MKNHRLAVQLLMMSLLAGCSIPMAVQAPDSATPLAQPAGGEAAGPASSVGVAASRKAEPAEALPPPVFPSPRVEAKKVTITGRIRDEMPTAPALQGARVYAPRREFNWQNKREELGLARHDGFELDVPGVSGRTLIVFFNASEVQTPDRIYVKSMYIDPAKPVVEVGDVLMGYRYPQEIVDDPGVLQIRFPSGHGELSRKVELAPLRTLDEVRQTVDKVLPGRDPEGVHRWPGGGECFRAFFDEQSQPIVPKNLITAKTDQPTIRIEGLDQHRWYAVRVRLELPGGGLAVTTLKPMLVGRTPDMTISKVAPGPGAILVSSNWDEVHSR